VQKLLIILRLFVKDVQKQKLRTFMTTFGIVWGTVSLIVLMSFGEGLHRHNLMQFRGLGERIVIVWPGSTKLPYQGLPKGRWLRMEPDAADLLRREIPNIERASPEFSRRVSLRVDRKNITQISIELDDLARRARDRKLKPDEMQGASFSISNLGGIGGTGFSPIVNWPEVAILGVSRGNVEPRWIDGEFRPRLMLPLSLSYDHRLVDGADAARFVRWLAEALEEPLLLALEG